MATTAELRRPGWPRLFAGQVRHHTRLFLRNPIGAVFGVGIPVVFLAIFAGLYGDEILVDGRWLGPSETSVDGIRYIQYAVPAMAVFSISMIAYVNLATATAQERGDGTLKRLRTTPLPTSAHVAGRIGAAMCICATITIALVVVGTTVYDFDIIWSQVPAAVVTIVLGTATSAALAMALVAVVRPGAVQAVAFGTLLPLSFLSEIFLFGDPLPSALSAIGWLFPLRHFSVSLAATARPDAAALGFAWGHLAVVVLWGVAGLVIALRWFACDTSGETRHRPHD